MAEIIGNADTSTSALKEAIEGYEADHDGAEGRIRRQNSAAIRLRVIDPEFADLNKSDRHKRVWAYLMDISEDVLAQVTMLLCITSEELNSSFANFEFENPMPSNL